MMDKTILVLEDERPLVEVIKIKLEQNGFKIVTARSVDQAVGYLEDGVHVDAIWLDHYLLGRENGLDFVSKLKHEKAFWRNIPIFVVTNTASPEKIQSYLHLGVEKYYAKLDYRLDQIITDIKTFLKTQNGDRKRKTDSGRQKKEQEI